MNKVKQIEDLKCRNYNNNKRGVNTTVALFNNNNLPIQYDDEAGLFGIFNLFSIRFLHISPNFPRNPTSGAFYIFFREGYTNNHFIIFKKCNLLCNYFLF